MIFRAGAETFSGSYGYEIDHPPCDEGGPRPGREDERGRHPRQLPGARGSRRDLCLPGRGVDADPPVADALEENPHHSAAPRAGRSLCSRSLRAGDRTGGCLHGDVGTRRREQV